MADDGSRSDGSNVDVEEVALRIALRQSLRDQGVPSGGGSASSETVARQRSAIRSGSASSGTVACQRSAVGGGFASSGPVARRRSAGDVAGPSCEVRSSDPSYSGRSAPDQVRHPPPLASAPEAVPSHRWVLVPASGTGHMRTPESEACAAPHERHRARKRGEALAARRSTSSASVNPEDTLLVGVLLCSLTMAETDVRRLRRKNDEALRLAIQLSEREGAKEVATKAKPARHTKEQDRLLHRLSGMRCSSDDDDNDVSTTSGSDDDDDDNNSPSHVDVYTEEGHNGVDDRNWKGRRANDDFLHPSPFCSYFK
ncbi:hypothetical protein D1007_20357 [Hordeum vulgare]|nr:hypothetical protein D1007_20357 [Hordeum vulgare]